MFQVSIMNCTLEDRRPVIDYHQMALSNASTLQILSSSAVHSDKFNRMQCWFHVGELCGQVKIKVTRGFLYKKSRTPNHNGCIWTGFLLIEIILVVRVPCQESNVYEHCLSAPFLAVVSSILYALQNQRLILSIIVRYVMRNKVSPCNDSVVWIENTLHDDKVFLGRKTEEFIFT